MVDRRISLKSLFIFTALVAIVVSLMVHRFPLGIFLGRLILVELTGATVGFFIRGRAGLYAGLTVGLFAFYIGWLYLENQ